MSNNPVTPNNFRRPPLRPSPVYAKQNSQPNVPPRPPYGPRPNLAKQVPPRPKKPAPKKVENSGPSAQEMYSSLSQAYNTMISNLQFMNAVGIVSGIYQNATNMKNGYQNPMMFTQEQMKKQMEDFLAEQQKQGQGDVNGIFNGSLADSNEKQAFFDEFYAYLTKRMASDNLLVNANKDSSIFDEGEQEEQVESDDTAEQEKEKYAECEAKRLGLSLIEYLNAECGEEDFEQFADINIPKVQEPIISEPSEISELPLMQSGEYLRTEEFSASDFRRMLRELAEKTNSEGIKKVLENVVVEDEVEEDLNADSLLVNTEGAEEENAEEDLDLSIFESRDEDESAGEQDLQEDSVLYDDDNEFFVDEEPEEVIFDDEEELADDVIAEEPKEEQAEEEQIIVAPKVAKKNASEDDEDYSDILVEEDSIDYSMTAKVLNLEDDMKVIYNDIKNYMLSYKGVKSRYSSACESFRIARRLVAKVVIIGRTFKLYLALNPEDYPNNIYHQKDESKKKAYIEVPFMVKIKSNLSIRKAKELIDKMMTENGLAKNFKYKDVDYVEILRKSIEDGE